MSERITLEKSTYDELMDIKNQRDEKLDELEKKNKELIQSQCVIIRIRPGYIGVIESYEIIKKGDSKKVNEIFDKFNSSIETEKIKAEDRIKIRRFKNSIWFKLYKIFNK